MKGKYDNEINEKYNQLTEQEKESMFKKQKLTKMIIVLIWSVFFVAEAIFLITGMKKDNLVACLCVSLSLLVCVVFMWWYFIHFFCRKKNIEKNKERAIKRMFKIERFRINIMSSVDGKKIKKTKIIDSYTEYSDKLHGFLNYQEIRQHRIYKFLVTFEDGSTGIYTAEQGTTLYKKLIFNLEKVDETNNIEENRSSADEIMKYKQLLDAGAITQEEYEQKKQKLLEK